MKLILDFGNTLSKLYLFSDKELVRKGLLNDFSETQLDAFTGNASITDALFSSTIELPEHFRNLLSGKYAATELNATTPLPITRSYENPETLGPDRVAAAVGGWQLFRGDPVLTVVAGTCITYNLVDSVGCFRGGAISPGLQMRLKAMHEFTGKLPLVGLQGDFPLTGYSTETCLRSGAVNGAIEEIKGLMMAWKADNPNLKVVISGGDGGFLAEALKNGIFARPELVAEGLNSILDYNVANRLV